MNEIEQMKREQLGDDIRCTAQELAGEYADREDGCQPLVSTGLVDALVEEWERKAKNVKLYGEIYTQALKDCALDLRLLSLRSDNESASTDEVRDRREREKDNL